MPQMGPLMWVNLLIMTTIMLMMFMNSIYSFIIKISMKKFNFLYSKNFSIKW